MNYDEYSRERKKERERGKSHWNLYMYCNFCRACNITWLLLIKSSVAIVSDKSSDVLDAFFCILSLSSQYIMEWWMKLLPLFCVILLSLGWWGDLSVPTLFFFGVGRRVTQIWRKTLHGRESEESVVYLHSIVVNPG